ncbi:DUF3300 domain-containing protein [Ralstonia chuxiongensis]|uniref:DUF3300 domain-containing protein n=1 Tax=Ralstonia chuxiongensis TaxID=2957504 RepID=UPI0028F67B8F|nr:DUF3300 domain-containing protein [Ralstonia chuxiongensis]CAJ0772690.1 hypothetical protein R8510_02876 [Ralstonia chuxiongensis]
MKAQWVRQLAIALALLLLFGGPAIAQPDVSESDPQPATAVQLDQMLAPIALYPDALVAQILMAATYPLEVVQADRWVRDPANAALGGRPVGRSPCTPAVGSEREISGAVSWALAHDEQQPGLDGTRGQRLSG